MAQNQEQRLPQIMSGRMLTVADYQRPYAWEDKQLDDLWEDLDLIGPRGTHYAGTLVLRAVVEGEQAGAKEIHCDDGTVLQEYEIVDGQQRLTTCFILLDRIRRVLEQLDARGVDNAREMAAGVGRAYGTVLVGSVPRTRLRLGADLQKHWAETVLGDEPHVGPALFAGQERLDRAVTFFDGKISALALGATGEDFLERLRELHRRITTRLGFLVYEVDSLAEVGVIFETLNERGRPLTDLEKAKNYFLYLARSLPDNRSDELAQEINDSWSEIFRNLAGHGRGQEDQLLRAHWLATQDADLRSWKRIDSIKKRFDRSNYVAGDTRLVAPERPTGGQTDAWQRLHREVRDYVRTLRHCSWFLAEMFDPRAQFQQFETDREAIIAWSAALSRSGVVAIYTPLLFAARLARGHDGSFYSRLLRACERYSARVFVIERRRETAGAARLARLARELFVNDAAPEWILAEIDAKLWQYAPDSRVTATLENVSENWYVRRGHKYFLYEYERSRTRARQELPDYRVFVAEQSGHQQRTTEHILPQHPDGDAACWWDHFTPDQHASLVNALGNLVLTYDNSSYSNKCFADKRGDHQQRDETPRRCYAQAELHQERELVRWSEWSPDAVRERQQELAAWALQRWRVENPPERPVDDPELESDGSAEDDAILAELEPDEA